MIFFKFTFLDLIEYSFSRFDKFKFKVNSSWWTYINIEEKLFGAKTLADEHLNFSHWKNSQKGKMLYLDQIHRNC